MARFSDTLRDQNGVGIGGAFVSVVASLTGQTATLTNDDGSSLSNPFTTNADGTYYFNTVDAAYDLTFRYGGRVIAELLNQYVGQVSQLPSGSVANSLGTASNVAPSQAAVGQGLTTASSFTNVATNPTTRTLQDRLRDLPVSIWDYYRPDLGDTLSDFAPQGNRAAATGRNVYWPPRANGYPLKSPITQAAAGQQFFGDGPTQSYWTIDTSFVLPSGKTVDNTGVIIIPSTADENEAGVTDMGFRFTQPSTTSRASLNQYPYAIYANDVSRLKLGGSVRVSNGWNGVCIIGGGGIVIGSLQLGCFNRPLYMDGLVDTTVISQIKLWPYGSGGPSDPVGLLSIYNDGVAYAQIGRVDGLGIGQLATFQQRVQFVPGTLLGGRAIGTIDALHCDGTFGRLEMSDGYIAVGSGYNTTGSATDYLFSISGGELELGPMFMSGAGGAGTTDLIQVTGGKFSFQGGGVIEAVPIGAAVAAQTGGDVIWIGGSINSGSNQARTRAFFSTTGGRLTLTDPRFIDIGTGSGLALNITNNDNHNIQVTALLGWGVSIPSNISAGDYYLDYTFTATPTAQFATQGDAVFTYSEQFTQYRLQGSVVTFTTEIAFSTNAFTTASGAFSINPGIPATPIITAALPIGRMDNVTFDNTKIIAAQLNTSKQILLQKITSNAASASGGTDMILPSKSAVLLNFSGSFAV